MKKIFPDDDLVFVRTPGNRAASYLSSLWLGVFLPILTLPRNILVVIVWPLLFGVLKSVLGVFALIWTIFRVLTLGVTGRMDVLNMSAEEAREFRLKAAIGGRPVAEIESELVKRGYLTADK